ncbi:helix-turn-helix domain-containing protein [Streptococcus gallolyticus subsp. gallolyticus]|uniref:Cro/CI family transcriptional regulator n=2 Tax=Streptococcus gallolyticus TaxID=315405 RepID=A0AA94M410_9STRE|nr:helix-turn-helix transcriptional regulator [Streptococcus gallolyticus]AQP43278.1 putative transcriptional regulator [Streptococcus gallolyticus subsp. gallolyticus DSM 16831]MCY7203149.1 helix-turn-helix domain-containing protein [Streptococcus gallolyticus subsp. gallolyticus]SQG80577.1 Cro/CI family transcriptional regulator [Streptococcus gallolyticus]
MNRLKELRKEKGLTQQGLADEIGITKRTYIYWEQGERQIKPDKAEKLADFFGVSVGYLLGFTTTPKRYDDEQIFENKETKEFLVFSPKENYENEKTKIENKILSVLQSELVIISDKDIQNIFNYIDSVRLDNPNTYQGKNFTNLLLKKDSDVSTLIKQLKNDGFSLVFDKID